MSAATRLQTAEALKALSFYFIKRENRGPEIHCRIWSGLEQLGDRDADKLVTELNSAIAPILAEWHKRYLKSAATIIQGSLERLSENDA